MINVVETNIRNLCGNGPRRGKNMNFNWTELTDIAHLVVNLDFYVLANSPKGRFYFLVSWLIEFAFSCSLCEFKQRCKIVFNKCKYYQVLRR